MTDSVKVASVNYDAASQFTVNVISVRIGADQGQLAMTRVCRQAKTAAICLNVFIAQELSGRVGVVGLPIAGM